jgi:hypothetical protein
MIAHRVAQNPRGSAEHVRIIYDASIGDSAKRYKLETSSL